MSKVELYMEMNRIEKHINGLIANLNKNNTIQQENFKEMQNKILGLEEKVKSLETVNNLSTNAVNDNDKISSLENKVKYLEDVNNFLAEESLGCDLLTYFEENAVEIANKANNKCKYYDDTDDEDDNCINYAWTKGDIEWGNKDQCSDYGGFCPNCQTMANITNYLRLLRYNK